MRYGVNQFAVLFIGDEMIPYDTYRYATNVGDRIFLKWIYDRLELVYGENPNMDYMITLRKFIDDWVKYE